MKAIFLTGTAGAGKTLLASKISEYYVRSGAFPAILNLDPGVESLPYSPDIDVRDFIDISWSLDSPFPRRGVRLCDSSNNNKYLSNDNSRGKK